ncbi:MAG: hypothetical protein WB721_15940, partial [Pseudolabrys sp.]
MIRPDVERKLGARPGSHCSVIKSRSSAALTLATGGFCFALVRMFNGHAPGYSKGLVRFDVELLQQPSAPYPHIERFTAGKSDRQPKAIIIEAHRRDLHLAADRGGLVTDLEVGVERGECTFVQVVEFRHLEVSFSYSFPTPQ